MRILRGPDPGPFKKHGEYKPHLQPLFRQRCAYCLAPDHRNGGLEGMTVDHFLDQKRHSKLKLAWTNLYYACAVCNSHYKKDYPTEEEERAGLRFVDPCKEDPDNHFCMVRDPKTRELCQVQGLSEAANYTIWRLHLNSRRALRDFWRELDAHYSTYPTDTEALEAELHAASAAHPEWLPYQRKAYAFTRRKHAHKLALIRSLRPFPVRTMDSVLRLTAPARPP